MLTGWLPSVCNSILYRSDGDGGVSQSTLLPHLISYVAAPMYYTTTSYSLYVHRPTDIHCFVFCGVNFNLKRAELNRIYIIPFINSMGSDLSRYNGYSGSGGSSSSNNSKCRKTWTDPTIWKTWTKVFHKLSFLSYSISFIYFQTIELKLNWNAVEKTYYYYHIYFPVSIHK